MQPIKLLSKLSIKTLSLTGSFGGSGQNVIDWRTAAHALAGLSQEKTNWAYLVYVGEETRLKSVISAINVHAQSFVKRKQYRIKPETVNGLAKAAVYEFIQPVCGICDGSGLAPGQKPTNPNPEVCTKCHGRGRVTVSKRSKCQIIGIGHKSYTDNHDNTIKEIMRVIAEWENDIFANIHAKMGEDE